MAEVIILTIVFLVMALLMASLTRGESGLDSVQLNDYRDTEVRYLTEKQLRKEILASSDSYITVDEYMLKHNIELLAEDDEMSSLIMERGDDNPLRWISQDKKKRYLQSKRWAKKKEKVFERDNRKCVTCGSKHRLNCHHITYERLTKEKLKDLTTLCEDCHTQLHDILGYSRDGIYEPERKVTFER